MRKVTAVLVGAGNRAQVYIKNSVHRENAIQIIGVVEPNEQRRNQALSDLSLSSDMGFENLEQFFSKNIECDLVINATMDNIHIETATKIMEKGYNQLLEKPITANKTELLDFYDKYKKSGTQIYICHVLRYTPFYKSIKKHLNNNEIGKIVTINMTEHVGVQHFWGSYLIGNWYNTEKCGSSFLLAKSCHDTDIMCWLNNSTKPVAVASFSDRKNFIPENAPLGAGENCYVCKHGDTCKYSVKNVWEQSRTDLDKKCLYKYEDICDRQHAIFQFENGSSCSFTLVGAVAKPDRLIHIIGEDGEIFGSFEDGKYTVRKYDFKTHTRSETEYCVEGEIKGFVGFHKGGDDVLCMELADYIRGDRSSISITSIEDSINGHLCVYSAEESAKTGKIVKI